LQIEDVEATHMGSGSYREFVAGLRDPGEGAVSSSTTSRTRPPTSSIRAAVADGVGRAYKIVLHIADGTTQEITGDCIVKGYERDIPDR
jgi:hypothetical protein